MDLGDNLPKYANEIPDEVKSVVRGLDSEVRLAIIVALMKNGRTTFSELKRLLNLNSSSLSSHLSILQNGGLIKNMLEWNENSYSYYVATDIATKVLQSLFDVIMPSPKHFSLSESTSVPQGSRSYLYLALENQFPIDAIRAVPQYKTIGKNHSN
jgi:DNA-binding HxlR family transcriptional regulator